MSPVGTTENLGAVIFDLDVMNVDKIDKDMIDNLKRINVEVRYVTNDCTLGAEELFSRFKMMGTNVEKEELFPASRVLAMEIARREMRATIYLLGTDGFRKDLQNEGLRVIERPEEIDYLADYIVVGHDENLSYTKLVNTLRCLDHGAKWAITSERTTLRMNDKLFPGPGVINAAVHAIANRPPDFCLGTPRPHILDRTIKSTRIPVENCAWIGDPTDTSAKLAKEFGVRSVLTPDDLDVIFQTPTGTLPESSPVAPSSTYHTRKYDRPLA